MGCADDRLAARLAEGRQKSVHDVRRNGRHVAQQDQSPAGIVANCRDPGLQRTCEPRSKVRIVREGDIEAFQCGPDPGRLVSGHHHDAGRARRERSLDGVANERHSVEMRHQLVRPAHPGRATGGKHDSLHLGRAFIWTDIARLCMRRDIHEEPTSAHRGNVAASVFYACCQSVQDPVKPMYLAQTRATRRADDWRLTIRPATSRLPGSTCIQCATAHRRPVRLPFTSHPRNREARTLRNLGPRRCARQSP